MTEALTMWSSADSQHPPPTPHRSVFLSVSLYVCGVVQLHKDSHRFLGYVRLCKGARECYHDDGIRNQPYIKQCVYICIFLLCFFSFRVVCVCRCAPAFASIRAKLKK